MIEKTPTGRDRAEVEARIERERIEEVERNRKAREVTLLQRRGEERKRARPKPPRRTFEQLHTGALLYDDVLPMPAPRGADDEGHDFISYDGWEGFGRTL